MEKNAPELQRLLGDRAAVAQLTGSREAKALAGLLTQGRDPAELQKIARDAASGNTQQLGELLRSVTSSPGGAQLLEQLSRTLEKQ